jgi:polyisoprenoid-binding protein YceI
MTRIARSTLFLLALALGVALTQTPSESQEGGASEFEIDTAHSSVIFRIQHLGVSYTYGRFNKFSGSIDFSPGGAGSVVAIEVDATSIDTNDEKRDNHLRSPDFFSAREFPAISFKSDSWEKDGEKTYKVTGTMNLHGESSTVTARVVQTGEGDRGKFGYRIGFEATLELKRSAFGMNKLMQAVGDDVKLIISAEAVRK